MLKGIVNFRAAIKGKGTGVTFPLFEFNPREPEVDKVEIGAPNGNAIRTTVHFTTVASRTEAKNLATKVNTAALNRISFRHNLVIESARMTGVQFSGVDSPPSVLEEIETGGYVSLSEGSKILDPLSAATLKAELEQEVLPGEHAYGLFRSAGLAASPVEEFMILYHILLLLHNDVQAKVDAFIVREDSTVPQTPDPRPQRSARNKKWWKRFGAAICSRPFGASRRLNEPRMETVYTRLRNELGHKRAAVDLDRTGAEMAGRVDELKALTKRAIELSS